MRGWRSNDTVAGVVAAYFWRSADGAEVGVVVVAAGSWWSADGAIVRQRRRWRAVGEAVCGQSRTWWIRCVLSWLGVEPIGDLGGADKVFDHVLHGGVGHGR